MTKTNRKYFFSPGAFSFHSHGCPLLLATVAQSLWYNLWMKFPLAKLKQMIMQGSDIKCSLSIKTLKYCLIKGVLFWFLSEAVPETVTDVSFLIFSYFPLITKDDWLADSINQPEHKNLHSTVFPKNVQWIFKAPSWLSTIITLIGSCLPFSSCSLAAKVSLSSRLTSSERKTSECMRKNSNNKKWDMQITKDENSYK